MMSTDRAFMARALELARQGRFTTTPNPNVGCVVVKEGRIVGEGYHQQAGGPHAEVFALRMAAEQAKGATVYLTLEPCSHYGKTPPCAEALIAAGISRVVAAMEDPNPLVAGRGFKLLRQAGIEVSHGLLCEQAERVNPGFFKRIRCGLPYLQLKLAASLDGKTAMASGESKWITSPQARQDVQRLRAQSSAILSTAATVLADDPLLTVRWPQLDSATQALYPEERLRQPVRVILDSRNRVTPQHRLVQQAGETWLARHSSGQQQWGMFAVEELLLPMQSDGIDLKALLIALGQRQINSIWTEAGPHLAGALLQAGLVDELILYLAPKLLGHAARGLCYLPGLQHLAESPEFVISDCRQIGPDLRIRLTPL